MKVSISASKSIKKPMSESKFTLQPVDMSTIIEDIESDDYVMSSTVKKKRERISTKSKPLITRKKPKLYSPKDDQITFDEPYNEIHESKTKVDENDTTLDKVKESNLATPKFMASCYKNIENQRIKCKRALTRKAKNVESPPSPTTTTDHDVYEHLKDSNKMHENDDEDLKQKKLEIPKLISTTTIDSGTSVQSTRRGRVISKVNYKDDDKESTNGTANKPKRKRAVRRNAFKIEGSQKEEKDCPTNLIEEKMREAVSDELNDEPYNEIHESKTKVDENNTTLAKVKESKLATPKSMASCYKNIENQRIKCKRAPTRKAKNVESPPVPITTTDHDVYEHLKDSNKMHENDDEHLKQKKLEIPKLISTTTIDSGTSVQSTRRGRVISKVNYKDDDIESTNGTANKPKRKRAVRRNAFKIEGSQKEEKDCPTNLIKEKKREAVSDELNDEPYNEIHESKTKVDENNTTLAKVKKSKLATPKSMASCYKNIENQRIKCKRALTRKAKNVESLPSPITTTDHDVYEHLKDSNKMHENDDEDLKQKKLEIPKLISTTTIDSGTSVQSTRRGRVISKVNYKDDDKESTNGTANKPKRKRAVRRNAFKIEGSQKEEKDCPTNLIEEKKREAVSDELNDEPYKEIHESKTKVDENDTTLDKVKESNLATPKSMASCYKNIENQRIKCKRALTRKAKNVESPPSPTTTTDHDVYEHLKDSNKMHENDDEDLKQKKLEIPKLISTTTIDSGTSVQSTRRGRVISKVNYKDDDKESTNGTANKPKRKRAVRRNALKIENSQKEEKDRPTNLIDKKMREAVSEELNTSFVVTNVNKNVNDHEPMIQVPALEVISDKNTDMVLGNGKVKDFKREESVKKQVEENTEKSKKGVKKHQKSAQKSGKAYNENEDNNLKNATKDDEVTISLLPIETELGKNEVEYSVTTNMTTKFAKIFKDGLEAYNDTITTQNMLSASERGISSPIFNITDELKVFDVLSVNVYSVKEEPTKTIIPRKKKEQNRIKDGQKSRKSIKSHDQIEHDDIICIESESVTESKELNERSISTDGITAHGDMNEMAPSPKHLEERLTPREISDMDENIKKYFIELSNKVNNTTDSTETLNHEETEESTLKRAPKRSGPVCNEDKFKKRENEGRGAETIDFTDTRQNSNVEDWLKHMAGSSEAYTGIFENLLEKLDTTLQEIHQDTTKNFVKLFVEAHEILVNMKAERRDMVRKIDQQFALVKQRAEECENEFMNQLKTRAAQVLKTDVQKKKALVAILRQEVEAVAEQMARTQQ